MADVDEAIVNLKMAIGEVDRALQDNASLEDRAHWLRALEWRRDDEYGAYQQLAFVIAGLKRSMAGQVPYGDHVTIDGVGVLTYSSSGGKTTWDWPGLVPVLAAQVADEVFDRETGEIPPLAVVCEKAIDAFGDVVGMTPSKSGRKTKLQERGIDPKLYVETVDAEPSVRIK